MKKILSLFVISSSILTSSSNVVSCSSSNSPLNPTISRNYNKPYYFHADAKTVFWDRNETFDIIFSEGNPNNLYLQNNDIIELYFTYNITSPSKEYVFNFNNIKLGTEYLPAFISTTFKITFNKDSMNVKKNIFPINEIQIILEH